MAATAPDPVVGQPTHYVFLEAPIPDIIPAAVRALAEKIAAAVMTNSSGEAGRLVLLSFSGRDIGGWARGPLTDRIEALLRGER